MNILGVGSGKKEFMTFYRLDKEDVMPNPYVSMINPEQFSKDMTVSYGGEADNPTDGSTDSGKSVQVGSITYNVTLMLDGTGVVPSQANKSVVEQLDHMMETFFVAPKSEDYTPNLIAISYCGDVFPCKVKTFNVVYNLFKSDGAPLRAKVTCSFLSVAQKNPPEVKKKESSSQSGGFESFVDALTGAVDDVLDSLFKLSI
ncbi:MAG: hypothetical protein J6U08_00160 [Paludibacteraceae bacterium]|nr:hypothetical protein [Paludibacteraceae bacterium]